jgi:hypothetical protein
LKQQRKIKVLPRRLLGHALLGGSAGRCTALVPLLGAGDDVVDSEQQNGRLDGGLVNLTVIVIKLFSFVTDAPPWKVFSALSNVKLQG